VSLSFPTSEHYVRTSRQLVSKERPFVPRVVYVTSSLLGVLYAVWIALALLLVVSHRSALAALRDKVLARLRRQPGTSPDPATSPEGPAF
jgi:hypothetical protein